MAFESVQNLAALQAAEDERKRRQNLAALGRDEADLADDVTTQKRDAASGPAALLQKLTGGSSRAAISGDVLKNADEDQFLNENATRRFERRATGLDEKKRDLSVPGPTATERYAGLTAPLGRFATEDPGVAASELRTDPRGRLAALEQVKNQIVGGNVSRETSDRPIMVGRGAADEPYFTNLSPGELHEERHATDAIRNRADLPDAGPAPHDFRRIHVGGTSLGAEGPQDDTPQRALLNDLEGMIGQAKGARATPAELAGDLVAATPEWDLKASTVGPAEIETHLNEAVASGQLRPETGQYLQRRYAGLQSEAFDDQGEFDPEIWRNRLTTGRPPAPGEAETRAKQPGPLPAAAQQEQAALEGARTPPPGGPGSTPSPALTAESANSPDGLLAGLRPQRQAQQIGGQDLGYEIGGNFVPEGHDAVPPWAAKLPDDVRLLLQGASFAAGGRESAAERRRRLAREQG